MSGDTARRLLGTAVAAGALGLGAASAQEVTESPQQPLWELRLGGSALYAPDYPGSDEYSWRGVGAPLFIYRGERLRIGADEPNAVARAIAIEDRRFELDVSVDANFGAESEDGTAREGMPDLDTQLEIGPQLTINLRDTGWTEYGRHRLRLLLPVRHVGATDFENYEELGYIFQPALTYRRQFPGSPRTSYTTTFSAVWASEGVQDYYYQVDPAFATIDRPAYDAKEGYLGVHMQVSARREVRPDLNVYLTYRLRSLAGAANEDSPLHREDLTHAFSVSVVWTALQSIRPARDND